MKETENLLQTLFIVEKDNTNDTWIVIYEGQIINGFENEEDAVFCAHQLETFFLKGFIAGAVSVLTHKDKTISNLKSLGVEFETRIDFD